MIRDHRTPIPAGVEFHERIAHNWSKGYSRHPFLKRLSLISHVLDRSVEPGQTWLDLGCGSGVLTKKLLDRYAVVTAVDGSSAMLCEANKLLGINSSLTYIHCDVTDLGIIKSSTFDGVLCSSVIEYIASPNLLLQEITRVLRSNGKLILSVPPTMSALRLLQKGLRKIASFWGSEKFQYLSVSKFEIEPREINLWFEDAGLCVDRVMEFDPIIPRYLFRLIRPSLMIIEARKR